MEKIGEFDFIRQYLLQSQPADPEMVLGIGDDAAIIRPRLGYDLCFSSDMLLGGRHFFHDVAPADLAHKILAVNISDIAAMGARPRWVLLSAGLPVLEPAWLSAFSGSLFAVAKQFGVTLIGGDTTRGDWAFNVTIVGELPQGQALRRSGAKVGDDIWVSGQVGLAAAALRVHLGNLDLPDDVQEACDAALLRPIPRVQLGQGLLPLAHAAMDVSDGLAQDLGHMLTASGVGAVVQVDAVPTLPVLRRLMPSEQLRALQLSGGDDYELLFTAPVGARDAIEALAREGGVGVSRIGQIVAGSGLRLLDAEQQPVYLEKAGFDHFG